MAQGVNIPITATNQASPVIDKVRASLNGLMGGVGNSSVKLTDKMKQGAVTAAAGAVGLAMSFKEVYGKIMEATYEAKRFVVMGQRFGMPAAEIAKLSRFAEQAGLNVGTMGRGILMLQKFAQVGIGGATGQTKDLIDKLGLTKTDLEEVRKGGMNAFVKIRQSMEGVMDEGEQMAVWQQLIGQRAFEMAEFLKKSPQEMEDASKNALGMSERVIQGLAKGQKVYANMQAEISKLFGELAHDLSWLFGLVGWLLTAIMTGVRMLRLVSVLVKGIVVSVVALLALMTGQFAKAGEMMDKMGKEISDTFSEVAKDVERDTKTLAFWGSDPAATTAPVRQARVMLRTMEEIAAYHEKINELKKEAFTQAMKEAKNDLAKIEILKEELRTIEQQKQALRAKYKFEADKTKEMLELRQKEKEVADALRDAERGDTEAERSLRFKAIEYMLEDRSARNKGGLMDAMSPEMTDERIEMLKLAYEAQQQYENAMDVMNDPTKGVRERDAAQLEFGRAAGAYQRAIALAMGQGARASNAPVDSLQAIGGGGAIGGDTIKTINQAMLGELTNQSGLLRQAVQELQRIKIESNQRGYGSGTMARSNTVAGQVANEQEQAQQASLAETDARRRQQAAEAAYDNQHGAGAYHREFRMTPQERANYDAKMAEATRKQDAKHAAERARSTRDYDNLQVGQTSQIY